MTPVEYRELNPSTKYIVKFDTRVNSSTGILRHVDIEGWIYCSNNSNHHGVANRELNKYHNYFKYAWGNMGYWHKAITRIDTNKFLNNFN